MPVDNRDVPEQSGVMTLARHIRNTGYDQLPEEAVVVAKREIPDTLGVTVAGSGAPGKGTLANLARNGVARRRAACWCMGDKVPARQAAMVNGAMGHALDFDDTSDRAAGHIHPGQPPGFGLGGIHHRRTPVRVDREWDALGGGKG